jgi:hypothetical protein
MLHKNFKSIYNNFRQIQYKCFFTYMNVSSNKKFDVRFLLLIGFILLKFLINYSCLSKDMLYRKKSIQHIRLINRFERKLKQITAKYNV